jgi:hypothetical protein
LFTEQGSNNIYRLLPSKNNTHFRENSLAIFLFQI